MIDKLRFVLNTHEQICHPGDLSVLVHECSSEEEKSITQLVSCLNDALGINQRACEFLVNLAQKMEIIEKNLHWATRGWVISRLPTNNNHQLTAPERVAYLKYYFDTDGALIVNFLKEFVKYGEIGFNMSEFLTDGGVERVFVKTAEEYMEEVFEISPRYELSKLLSAGEKGYSPKVRTDKFLPHIEPLVDLGFVDRKRIGNMINYIPHIITENESTINYSSRLLDNFNSIVGLDDIFSQNGDFFKRAAVSFNLKVEPINLGEDYPLIKRETIKAYDEVKDQYFRMARLGSIYDLVCIRLMFAPYNKLCEQADAITTIQRMNKISEDKIRFHMDDMGTRKYVTMSEDYVNAEINETIKLN